MRPVYFVLLTLGIAQATGAAKDEMIKKDKDGMQGAWNVIEIYSDGIRADVTKLVGAKITIKGDKATGKGVRLGKDNETSFRLDPTQKPKAIDFIHQDGVITTGIYDLEGDKLKICNTIPKSPRPKDFEPKKGAGLILIILRRDK